MAILLRKFAEIFSMVSNYCRIFLLRAMYPGLHIDYSSTIEKNCRIRCIKGGSLIIKRSHISYGTQVIADSTGTILMEDIFVGRNCVITSKNKVTIAKGVMIAEMVVIRDQDHATVKDPVHQEYNGFTTAPIVIEENVWIAAKATVLKGVHVGAGAVLAASAVVNKPVPAGELWGGVPAKFLKTL